MSAKPSYGEILAKAGVSAAPFGGVVNQVVSGLQARRDYNAEHALGAIAERVGEDILLASIEGNPELEALLWLALQEIVATGMESKRTLLRDVVVTALTSDEPIDPEVLKALAIAELEAPHFRALARLAAAEDADRLNAQKDPEDGEFSRVAHEEPFPVLTALIRNGLVYTGSVESKEEGLYTIPDARIGGMWGISSFGRELLADVTERGFARP